MKKYILLFLLVALASYGFFTLLNRATQAEQIIPVTSSEQMATPPKETKNPVVAPPPSTSDSLIVVDTTIFKKDKDAYYDISWKQLSKVEFNEVFVDSMDAYIPFPVFHPEIKWLEGKKIKVKGYVIPIEETGDEKILVLSAFPFTNCFFCGNAGPESVMDIKLRQKTKKRYKRDDKVSFKGRLRLNDSDLYYLNYILEDATE